MILQALAKARRIADELDPVSPRPDGLTIALGELAARSAVNAGAVVQFTTRRTVDVSDRHVALHLFRVAERAVQDALMISGAKRVTITLARVASGLQLTVAASNLPRVRRTANAPRGAWRASIDKTKALGGRLTIARSPRTGSTTVACVLPDGRGTQDRR
jgi:signal transduction histidine kinase